MNLLAIDAATEACSAAVYCEGEVHARFELAPREHANLILPMVQQVLSEAGLSLAQLDVLAFGRGPGSFTGVRIATGVIQAMGFALDLPVVPVSTLAALAHGAWREHGHARALAAIDARMGEVYWGAYVMGGQGAQCVSGEHVGAAETVGVEGKGWFGVGTGWAAYQEALLARLPGAVSGWAGECYPRAHDVALLGAAGYAAGAAVPAEQALPVYLRDKVV